MYTINNKGPEMQTFIRSNLKKPKICYHAGNYFTFFNHEIWRRCYHCTVEWDARQEPSGIYCPNCGKLGVK